MKKCLILLAILFTVLTISILTEEAHGELSENTYAISKVENENSELRNKFDEQSRIDKIDRFEPNNIK